MSKEEFKWDIDKVCDGHLTVHLKGFSVVDIFYKAKGCKSPLDEDAAEKLANEFKCRFESEYPVEKLDEDHYKPAEFGKLMREFIEFLEDDDDCDCCGI